MKTGHINRLGIRIKTPPELILARIGEEFEQSLAATKWSRAERQRRIELDRKRYRVVTITLACGGLSIIVDNDPQTFQQAQTYIDYRYEYSVRRKTQSPNCVPMRLRIFMQEIT